MKKQQKTSSNNPRQGDASDGDGIVLLPNTQAKFFEEEVLIQKPCCGVKGYYIVNGIQT